MLRCGEILRQQRVNSPICCPHRSANSCNIHLNSFRYFASHKRKSKPNNIENPETSKNRDTVPQVQSPKTYQAPNLPYPKQPHGASLTEGPLLIQEHPLVGKPKTKKSTFRPARPSPAFYYFLLLSAEFSAQKQQPQILERKTVSIEQPIHSESRVVQIPTNPHNSSKAKKKPTPKPNGQGDIAQKRPLKAPETKNHQETTQKNSDQQKSSNSPKEKKTPKPQSQADPANPPEPQPVKVSQPKQGVNQQTPHSDSGQVQSAKPRGQAKLSNTPEPESVKISQPKQQDDQQAPHSDSGQFKPPRGTNNQPKKKGTNQQNTTAPKEETVITTKQNQAGKSKNQKQITEVAQLSAENTKEQTPNLPKDFTPPPKNQNQHKPSKSPDTQKQISTKSNQQTPNLPKGKIEKSEEVVEERTHAAILKAAESRKKSRKRKTISILPQIPKTPSGLSHLFFLWTELNRTSSY